MNLEELAILIIVGAVAGWLAAKFMKGKSFSLLGNIIVGVIGAFIGDFIFNLLGISFNGIIGSIIAAFAGAVLLLFIIKKLK